MTSLDLDAYFERIGWTGTTRADFDTLAGLLRAHMSRIPFENLDVLLGRRIRLDLEGLQQKLVRARRGGYCFEHGTLFAAVLERLGFRLTRHTARVVLVVLRSEAPRAHMFLTVALDQGAFVVDPGFGGLAPAFPVPLVESSVDEAATHWMVRDENHWVLRTRWDNEAIDGWVSTLDADNVVDFEVGNHYTSTHPKSGFVNRLALRALTDDGRVTAMNRDVTIWKGGVPHRSQLADRRALRALLAEHFGFDLPEVESLRVPMIPEWE